MPLRLEDYNSGFEGVEGVVQNPIPFNNATDFLCNPGRCTYSRTTFDTGDVTEERYFFCGGEVEFEPQSCSIDSSEEVMSFIGEGGAEGIGGEVSTIDEVCLLFNASRQFIYSRPLTNCLLLENKIKSSHFIFNQTNQSLLDATLYGGLFFTHEADSIVTATYCREETDPNNTFVITNDTEIDAGSNLVCYNETYPYAEFAKNHCLAHTGDYMEPSECDRYGSGIGYTIAYNFSALHAAVSHKMLGKSAFLLSLIFLIICCIIFSSSSLCSRH